MRLFRNPHGVGIHDDGVTVQGHHFIAMEWLPGQLLSAVLAATLCLPPTRAAHIGAQIARFLCEAHGLGLVHCDLKPDNVILMASEGDPDFVKVLDLGSVASLAGRPCAIELPRSQAWMGTPWYSSPEQALGLVIDDRSDLYSLGVIMYEMLTGVLPFGHGDARTVMAAHIEERPPPVPEVIDGRWVPTELRLLIHQLLDKAPARRPASAQEVAERLGPFANLCKDASSYGSPMGIGSSPNFLLALPKPVVHVETDLLQWWPPPLSPPPWRPRLR